MSSWSLWSDLLPAPFGGWVFPDLRGFYKSVFVTLDILSDFTKRIVASRLETGIRKWTGWLWEDLGARPYDWLRPDFVPPSPFLVMKDPQAQLSQILVEPHLIDAEFRKAWMPFSVGLAILSSLLTSFWLSWVIFCLRNLCLIFQGLRVGTCRKLRRRKRLLQVDWMVGLGMRSRLCLCLGFLVWLPGVWPQDLLAAYFAMIPKADGDSTPPGQRPLSVLPVVYRLWASLRLGHLRKWVVG